LSRCDRRRRQTGRAGSPFVTEKGPALGKGRVRQVAICVSSGATRAPPCFGAVGGICRSRELFRVPPEEQWLGAVLELLLVVPSESIVAVVDADAPPAKAAI
jgi:hypothetical protein